MTRLVAPALLGTFVASCLLGALAGVLLGPLAALVGFWVGVFLQLNRLAYLGNRRLRSDVADKLRGLGHAVETGHDSFVGLAYPCFYGTPRRWIETDDDVGFLTVDPRGLVFVGDGDEFTIPADRILEAKVVRDEGTGYLLPRVRVTTLDGQPQEVFFLDCRNVSSLSAAKVANHQLAKAIMAMRATPSLQRRLGTDVPQQGLSRVDAA